MPTPLFSKIRFLLSTAAVCSMLALPARADSQARIVRLSDVQGSVQINKNSGTGFENAFLNLPVTQGVELRTGSNGRAEVEFEDGSTLRIAPYTDLVVSTLSLNDAGKRTSVLNLVEGMAYVNWLGKSGDAFTLNFSNEKVSLDQAAHFRIDTMAQATRLAVFKGDVEAEGPSGKVVVAKNKTATFDPSADDKSKLADNIAEAPLDSWDREAIAYHDQYARTKPSDNSSPYGYGLSDLNYYGGYYNVPGYGTMWQPYFTGVGWDPFMDGAWGWYPGMGYMFASAYPWGWLPYRYGNWMFVPGSGWMWQPGGWNMWSPTPVYTPTPLVHVHPLIAPTGTVDTVSVGKGGAVSPTSLSQLTVRGGSAGFGVPRGSISDLSHLNHEVAKNGFAEVHAAPQFSTSAAKASDFGAAHGSMAASSMGHAGGGHASGGGGGHH
jgi:hypothetical protein